MATGIANAIIYVRGVDLLSKPISRALSDINRQVAETQRKALSVSPTSAKVTSALKAEEDARRGVRGRLRGFRGQAVPVRTDPRDGARPSGRRVRARGALPARAG